jgi:two-component system, cell cycle sensor histidine kinase and response regulator CckA
MTQVDWQEGGGASDELRLTRITVDKAPDPVLWIGRDGRILYGNEAASRTFGYTREELLALKITDLDTGFPEEDIPLRWKHLVDQESLSFEASIRASDGTLVPVEVTAHHVVHSGGELGVSIVRDLTRRRRAEEEVRISDSRVRRLIDASPMGMLFYRLEEDGRLVLVSANPAADRLLGMDLSGCVGETIEEVFPGLVGTEVPERYREAAAKGTPWQADQLAYDHGQTAGVYEVVAFQTAPREMAAFFLDVTERKRAVEAIRESEARFRTVVEESNDAIYILFRNRFDLVNRRFCELTGVPREEVGDPGFSFWSLVDPESLPLIQERQNLRARGEKVPGVYDFIIRTKDGTQVEVEASVTEIDYQGGKAVLGILRDKSEQNRLEEQLRQSQKLESIGRLSGGVAHDLNNLLSPIIVYGEMLLDDLGREDDRRELAEEIVAAAARSRDLIRQLLAFSRKQTLRFRPVELNSLITNFQKLLRRTIREDIHVELRLTPELPLIQADLGQVEQVLMNLAVNAEDAMPGGGLLTIETAPAELDQEYATIHPGVKPGRYVLLAVTDDGVGMDETTMGMVFEPFFTTKEKGTGLGLA